ncbi:MAG: aminopeptidase P family protein, partial [Acidobacteria bacterium]
MISRRRILKLGTAAAGAALATPVTAATSENNCTALPPSIASLTSMKDQAKPITTEERGERQEKARRLMADNKLDAILLTEGTSLTYFSGIHWGGSERLFAMVLPVKGNVFYVCPAFEEGRAREQIAKAPGAEQADVRIWQEDGSPYQRVAQGLNDRGLSTGTLGMEETVRFVFSQGIGKASPQMKIASATPVTAGCRMIKSNHEVELMRLAAKVTLTAYEAAYHALNPGMTKPQLEEMVEAAHTRLGFSGSADAQVGEYSAFPHGSITPQVIREGAIVLMDGGGNVEGYASDITRTFVLGKPSDKMKTVFDIVHRAQTAALKTARPGLECQAVDAAARSVITDAGYGPDYKF